MSPLLEDLAPLFFQTVTIRKRIGNDIDGYPLFEVTGTPWPSRVAGKITNVLGQDGQVHATSIVVTFKGNPGVTTQDLLEVPVEFSRNPRETDPVKAIQDRQYEPIAVETLAGRTSLSHQKVYL